ncbi:MAG: PAS domain S-box protein, partial [Candidatus Binatia bacterium]
VFVLSATGGSASLWSSRLLIRIPFLITAAAFYGYIVDGVRRERQRAREEAETVAHLEEVQHELSERAQQLERANEDLAREISERERAEQALKAAKDYAQGLIGSSLDMIVSTDVSRNIVEFNQAAEDGFGYSKAEVVGKPISILYADLSEGLRVQADLRNNDRFAGEVRNKRKNGEAFYAFFSASVIRDANGTIVGGVSVSRDITESKQAEEVLERLSRQNELILKSAPEGIYGLDLEGKTTFINPAGARMIGWEVEDLIGKPQHAILHHSKPDGTPYPRDECPIYAAFKDGTVRHVDTEVFWRKDGTSFPVEYTSTPIRDENAEFVGAVVTFRDITERKRAEEALRRYKHIVAGTNDFMAFLDRDYRFQAINQSYLQAFGKKREEIIGNTAEALFGTEVFETILKPYQDRCLSGEEVFFEAWLDFPVRGRRFMDVHYNPFREPDGSIAGIVVSVRDNTDRKQAEETMRLIVEGTSSVTGKDFFHSLVRHLAVAVQARFVFISELVDEDGKRVRTLAFWTGKDFAKNFEYNTKGTPCENVIIGKGLSYYTEGVQKLFPDDHWLAEAGMDSYLGIPFFNSSGKVIGHMGVMDDKPMGEGDRIKSILKIFSTRVGAELERKRAEEELKAAQLQLIQSEKLESVGRLAAGVAHEVKNPLAIILQGLAYLSHAPSTADDDKVAMVLQKMDNAVKRADRVIGEMLDFSAQRAGDVRPTDVNAVLEQSLLLVKHELVKAHVPVVKKLGQDLPPLMLDRHKIEQVFVNLFLNAIKAMPEGGTLTVKTYATPPTEFGSDVGRRKTDQFRIGETLVVAEVLDTGTGIPTEKLDRVFDPFFTIKPTGEGTGLGLTVTRKIIELHGGKIDIRNRQKGGVRVTLTFKTDDGRGDAGEVVSANMTGGMQNA